MRRFVKAFLRRSGLRILILMVLIVIIATLTIRSINDEYLTVYVNDGQVTIVDNRRISGSFSRKISIGIIFENTRYSTLEVEIKPGETLVKNLDEDFNLPKDFPLELGGNEKDIKFKIREESTTLLWNMLILLLLTTPVWIVDNENEQG